MWGILEWGRYISIPSERKDLNYVDFNENVEEGISARESSAEVLD